jgi:hypothetical protein
MPYENISGLIDLNAEAKYKIAIVGPPGVGKSWFAYTFPSSIFSYDFDTREESMKEFCRKFKRTNIEGKKYFDLDPNAPNAMQNMETDIAMFEYLASAKKLVPETHLIDSMSYMRPAMEHEIIKQQPTFARKVKINTSTVNVPSGWDVINGVTAYTEYIVGRLSALGNVIMVFHEIDEGDRTKSTKEQKAYTGMKTIKPQYLSGILSLFDHVFRMKIDYAGNRVVQCQPDSDFITKTSMKLDAIEQPNLADMIAKHKTRS